MKESEIRNEIAHSIKCVRSSCFGRKCLKDCVRRMVAAAPHPRATRRRWGAAVAAVFMSLGAYAQVFCSWVEEPGIQAHYECTGQGQYITVNAADQVVVTNMFGGCTNCINVTPGQCNYIKDTVRNEYLYISNQVCYAIRLASELRRKIASDISDINSFRHFLPGWISSNVSQEIRDDFTNYVYTVDNSQTQLDRAFHPNVLVAAQTSKWIFYNDGIYDYAKNFVEPSLKRDDTYALNLETGYLPTIGHHSRSLYLLIEDNLNCEACTDAESGGNCDCNESTGGKWCTEEQGDAIIRLLEDTKDYVDNLSGVVVSISNNVEIAVQNLHDGFFTSYDHVPTEEELGSRWQDLYLEGYSPNFHEYAKTNILARIELLLAGMSGVLTNNADYADAGEFADTGLAVTNEFENSLYGLTNGVAHQIQLREEKVRSVGDSLIGLYNVFRGWSGTPFSRQTLIGSYSVEIGENHWDVPSFEPSANGLEVANVIRLVCRSVMSVFYILFTVVVFVRFHIAFFQWVLKYLKWAIELMQGLFI